MSTFEHVAGQYRGLRLSAIAQGLEDLLKQAQDNELSYLQFAHLLAGHELGQRERKRVESNPSTGSGQVVNAPASRCSSTWRSSITRARPRLPSVKSTPCSTSVLSNSVKT